MFLYNKQVYCDNGQNMKIAILGYGVVGKGVAKLAIENKIDVSYILMRQDDDLILPNMCKDLDTILNDNNVECVVECIGGDEPAFSYVKRCLNAKKNVVSSNKKMLVNHFEELYNLSKKNNVNLLFSAACGGGIPWIKTLSNIKNISSINYFEGIMNGTSNFILDNIFTQNVSFEDSLKKAQMLGYAEADPSDDVDGLDTANKTILSSIVAYGANFKINDLFIKGIRYFNNDDLKFCLSNHYRCVLVGKGTKIKNKYHLTVMPRFVNKKSAFYSISKNHNCFILNTNNLNDLCLIGQGAGSLPTANNIINDIFDLNKPYTYSLNNLNNKMDYDSIKSKYYIRTNHLIDNKYIDIKINQNCFISKEISINEIKEFLKDDDFIGEISND
ncbi:MAG: homoserine dehydrogenase [Erysipelotrichaceae bacterium]|nr:homoserine dehydrogenase [Erysipelotrichaceae bacterium]